MLGPLRVLDAVYRCGGVGRAAERLHITAGAVSHQIRKLETELGTALVFKDGREIGFTEAGRTLALQVADLFDRLETVVDKVANAGGERPIRVKVIPSFAIQWLMPRLANFYARHQDIDVEIATVSRADDTDLNNADFVVRRGRGDWPDLRADLLFRDALVLACAPEVATRLHRPEDVLGEKLLRSIIAPDSWDMWLRAVGLEADGNVRFIPLANAALCLQAAAQSLGVAVTQRAYLTQEFASGTLVQPLPQVASSEDGYYLVWDPAKSRQAPYRKFAEWMLGAL